MLKYKLPNDLSVGTTDLTPLQLTQLLVVLSEFKDLFAVDPNNPGHVDPSVATHKIDTGDANPINQGPRRVSPEQRKIIKQTIDDLLKANIISPSRSPWSSPVLLVPKGEGYRMCIDYRKLNAVTRKEIYALPRVDDVLDALGGAMYFSTLDLASGYFQIPMDPNSKDKTAFITYDGQYEYNYMSFGLVNAPSTFQRCMDTVLAGLKWSCVQIYLDDAIIASPTFEQHLIDITAVLTRFKEAGFKLKSGKCHFCCSEVEYLGHLITREGVKANPKKIDLITNWGIPQTASNLHSFLGLAGYYRKLINKFAMKEAPLRRLLNEHEQSKKNPPKKSSHKPFKLGPIEIEAFRDIQQCLIKDPVIALPDFSGKSRFELHTDASDLGISAILTQIGPDNTEHVIQYASRMLTKQELKWHTQEKEALAIVWGCHKFRPYLLGSEFVVKTDHQSLQWLMRSDKGKLARWALSLSEFNYKIVHRSGKSNVNADVASRWTKTKPDVNWDAFPEYAEPRSITMFNSPDTGRTVLNIVSIQPVVPTAELNDNLRTQLLLSQKRDISLAKAYKLLADGCEDKASECLSSGVTRCKSAFRVVIHQGLVARLIENNLTKEVTTQFVVPSSDKTLQLKILQLHHDTEMSGHLGYSRTLARVQSKYVWPSVRQDCKNFVKSCGSCQAHKSTAPGVYTRTLNPSLPTGPNVRLSVDLIGPLPSTEHGHTYALDMVDYFTKYAISVPLKSKEGGEVADAIYKNWYCVYGIPYEIQTDQGTEFTNDVIKRLNIRLAVGHRVTTPYYPQANGEVEIWNRTLKRCVAIYAEKHPGTWDKYISGVVWSYNTSLNPNLGFSPFYLMFGREPRLPSDITEGSYSEIRHDIEQYKMQMTLGLRNAHQIVRKRLEQNAVKMKLAWDSKVQSHVKFNIGDKVLMYQPQMHKKANEQDHSHVWKREWLGPFTVLGQKYQNNSDVYIIRDNDTEREWTINSHKLRPYHERTYLSSTQESQKAPLMQDMRLDVDIPVVARSNDDLMPDTSDAVIPIRNSVDKPLAAAPRLTKHRNSKRHTTGKTNQENKREKERERFNNSQAELDLVEENDPFQEYVVDKILSHKKVRNGYKYLVKWEDGSNTWEPASNFCTKGVLNDYWVTQPVNDRPRQYKKIPSPKVLINLPNPYFKATRTQLTQDGGDCRDLDTQGVFDTQNISFGEQPSDSPSQVLRSKEYVPDRADDV